MLALQYKLKINHKLNQSQHDYTTTPIRFYSIIFNLKFSFLFFLDLLNLKKKKKKKENFKLKITHIN